MQLDKKYIKDLVEKNQWSLTKFAKECGVSKTTVSRWFLDKRGEGKILMSGVIKAFPNEPIDKLFIINK